MKSLTVVQQTVENYQEWAPHIPRKNGLINNKYDMIRYFYRALKS